MFGFGKKKKAKEEELKKAPDVSAEKAETEPAEEPEEEEVSFQGESGVNTVSDERAAKIYDTLMGGGGLAEKYGARQEKGGISLSDPKLIIHAYVQRVNEHNGNFSAEVLYSIYGEDFEEPVIEFCAGLGHSEEEALSQSAETFSAVVLMSVIAAFGCTGDHTVKTELEGQEYVFRRSCVAMVASIGEKKDNTKMLWELVEPVISKYLGTKKYYWVRLYASCVNGRENCEVRVNGQILDGLTELLNGYVRTWSDMQTFHSEKQFVFLIRNSGGTGEVFPKAENVIEAAMKTIAVLPEIQDEVTNEIAGGKIYELCGRDTDLSWELRNFVPEIYAYVLLDVRPRDTFTVIRGEETIELTLTQMRHYGYIREGCERYLRNNNPGREFNIRVLALSATYSGVMQAVEAGSKINELDLTLQMTAPADYRIR